MSQPKGSGRSEHGVVGFVHPGLPADLMERAAAAAVIRADAFERVVFKPRSAIWARRQIDDRDVRWVDTAKFSNAFWARDRLVVHVGGPAADLQRVIRKLP